MEKRYLICNDIDGDALFDEAESKEEFVDEGSYGGRWSWSYDIKGHKVIFLKKEKDKLSPCPKDLFGEVIIIGEDEVNIK